MNLDLARFNMIEQQIRPWDVLDQRVLTTIADTPRDLFVPPAYRQLAYSDTRIPIGQGQVMMNPNVEGRLLQALNLQPSELVLEVGTGSGYLTACLASMATYVYSVEIFPELSERAQQKLAEFGVSNVNLSTGDASKGWDDSARYDAIAITGSMPEVPEAYMQALAEGGRLFVIVGDTSQPIMEAKVMTRISTNQWVDDSLFETTLPPLVNAANPQRFVF